MRKDAVTKVPDKRKTFFTLFSCFLAFKIIHCVIMKKTINDAARRDPPAEGQQLDCLHNLTQGACWDSLQENAFKNSDS